MGGAGAALAATSAAGVTSPSRRREGRDVSAAGDALGYSLNSSHRLAKDSTSPSRKDLRCVRRTLATSSWLFT